MGKEIWIIFFTVGLFIVDGCQTNKKPCSHSKEVLIDINRIDSVIKIPETLERDRQIMKANYDEPSILDAKNETYRFTLSSSDYSKVVRIENRNNYYYAIIKEFEGTTGDPNLVPKIEEFEITKHAWDSIIVKLKDLNFWIYPSSTERKGLDGSYWTLTAYKPIKDKCTMKNIHIINRWSPIDTTFINMCELFSKLKK